LNRRLARRPVKRRKLFGRKRRVIPKAMTMTMLTEVTPTAMDLM